MNEFNGFWYLFVFLFSADYSDYSLAEQIQTVTVLPVQTNKGGFPGATFKSIRYYGVSKCKIEYFGYKILLSYNYSKISKTLYN